MMQRYDYELIQSWIPERSRVLDLGCGDGVLLAGLAATNAASGYGIEIDDANVLASVKNGVNVIQDDIERGLWPRRHTFDFVILADVAGDEERRARAERDAAPARSIVTFPNLATGVTASIFSGATCGVEDAPAPVVRHPIHLAR
jgi:methionine biosynthesis protein MetW